jgi:hypothetical protein
VLTILLAVPQQLVSQQLGRALGAWTTHQHQRLQGVQVKAENHWLRRTLQAIPDNLGTINSGCDATATIEECSGSRRRIGEPELGVRPHDAASRDGVIGVRPAAVIDHNPLPSRTLKSKDRTMLPTIVLTPNDQIAADRRRADRRAGHEDGGDLDNRRAIEIAAQEPLVRAIHLDPDNRATRDSRGRLIGRAGSDGELDTCCQVLATNIGLTSRATMSVVLPNHDGARDTRASLIAWSCCDDQ